jgi:hypothetical protein
MRLVAEAYGTGAPSPQVCGGRDAGGGHALGACWTEMDSHGGGNRFAHWLSGPQKPEPLLLLLLHYRPPHPTTNQPHVHSQR